VSISIDCILLMLVYKNTTILKSWNYLPCMLVTSFQFQKHNNIHMWDLYDTIAVNWRVSSKDKTYQWCKKRECICLTSGGSSMGDPLMTWTGSTGTVPPTRMERSTSATQTHLHFLHLHMNWVRGNSKIIRSWFKQMKSHTRKIIISFKFL